LSAIVKWWLPLVLVCAPALAQDIPDDPAERSSRAKETEQALEKLRGDVAELKAALETGQRAESDAVAAVADAERAVSDHQRTLSEIAGRSAGHEAELVRIGEEQQRIGDDIASQRDALAALLRLTYTRSRQAPAKLLLDPDRAPRIERSLGYGRVLQQTRLKRIETFANGLAELATLADAEVEALAAAATERAAAETTQVALDAAVVERAVALEVMRQELGGQRERVLALAKDERGMLRLLEQLRDIFADLPKTLDGAQPFRSLRGTLAWPVDGRADDDNNKGLLIAADAGAPVRAVAHGRVAFADWLKGYGLLVIVDHGDGYMTLYGHNDSLLKAEGAWVQAGDTIANVGRSGGESQPGLYFELRERGRSIAARPWLRRR
jgi:septal ring factor EnvC (AmiA/AmiB activator)